MVFILAALGEVRNKLKNNSTADVFQKYGIAFSSLKVMLGIDDLDMMLDKIKDDIVLLKMARLNDIIRSWQSQIGVSLGVMTTDDEGVDVPVDASGNGGEGGIRSCD